ncbi:hypothetical protein Mapa_014218 [Marchantia paleacea]|nr:hypothetical protein Mapa_014218 [Marchantia paleacea]
MGSHGTKASALLSTTKPSRWSSSEYTSFCRADTKGKILGTQSRLDTIWMKMSLYLSLIISASRLLAKSGDPKVMQRTCSSTERSLLDSRTLSVSSDATAPPSECPVKMISSPASRSLRKKSMGTLSALSAKPQCAAPLANDSRLCMYLRSCSTSLKPQVPLQATITLPLWLLATKITCWPLSRFASNP